MNCSTQGTSAKRWISVDESSTAFTHNRVIGFAPSDTCSRDSSPPPSVFADHDNDDDNEANEFSSPFGEVDNKDDGKTMNTEFAGVHMSGTGGFNNAVGYHLPATPPTRQSSALTSELQGAAFESAMYRLRSLKTTNTMKSNEKIASAAAEKKNSPLPQTAHSRAMRSASFSSSAMAIPLSSRAHTTPDQLPELTDSMVERLLAKMRDVSPVECPENPVSKNKTPEVKELCSSQRRMNFSGKRVPSAAFLNELNILKIRQESIDFGEVKRSAKARN